MCKRLCNIIIHSLTTLVGSITIYGGWIAMGRSGGEGVTWGVKHHQFISNNDIIVLIESTYSEHHSGVCH